LIAQRTTFFGLWRCFGRLLVLSLDVRIPSGKGFPPELWLWQHRSKGI